MITDKQLEEAINMLDNISDDDFMAKFTSEFVSAQKPLDADFEKVLNDNIEELYS